MKSTYRLASAGIMAVGLTALALVGATAANASGLKPVGVDDYYSMPQGGSITIAAPGILANDSDAEGSPLLVGNDFGYSGADFVQVNFDGSFTFTPSPSFFGAAGFHYYPEDDDQFGNETAVYIEVVPTVVSPVVLTAVDDSYSTQQDTVLVVPASAGLLVNDSALGFVGPVNGPATNDVVVNQDGSFAYTPAAGFVGTTSFSYRTTDGTVFSNDAVVTLTVTAGPGDPPVIVNPTANPDQYTTAQDTALVIDAAGGLLVNDSFPGGAIVTIDDSSGEIVAQLDGSFVYTPATGFVGIKEFAYRMSDGTAQSGWASVSITVTAVAPRSVEANP